MTNWTMHDIPDQSGRRVIITGATGGLGYETALALAGAHAEVILTGRDGVKGQDALDRIKAAHPNARIRFELLDLARLESIVNFAQKFESEGYPIDLLINNAGVMALPTRQLTVDGFELQIATNYLGHFALTGRLLSLLTRGSQPRVVHLSSLVHRHAAIDLSNLQSERYSPWKAYSQSKLAMLMFAFELQRRSDAAGWGLMSNAAHPGWARTDLFANGPSAGEGKGLQERLANLAAPFLSHSAGAGALPTLFAATSPYARPAVLYGPSGFLELKGPPSTSKVAPQAKNASVAARLWELSESLTRVSFPKTDKPIREKLAA